MKNFKAFLVKSFGAFGEVLFFVISIAMTIFPLLMFDLSWWLYMALTLLVQLFVVGIPFGIEILWVVGLFGAISGPQDALAYAYYVLFALIIGSTIVRLIKLFSRR